ncbi:MAG TPA: phosphotransferase [Stellaceae bacterium]|nr:phosphotransferase [Stellaceae bacterium]
MSTQIIANLRAEDVAPILAGRRLGDVPLDGCRVVGPVRVRRTSRLFRCTADELAGAVALKFCLTTDGKPDFTTAQSQFAALERIAGLASRSATSVRVVRALGLIEEHACLAMEWIEGRSVAAALAGPMIAETEIRAESRAAGCWLRGFHAMHRLADRPMSCAIMLANLELQTPPAQALASNRHFALGQAALERTALTIESIPVPIAHHHGDFKAENLMMTGVGLVGLDIAAHWDDAVMLDLAKFTRDLTFGAWRPSGWLLGRRHRLIADAFLDGYGASGHPTWQAPLHWAQLHGLLRFWIERAAAPADKIRDSYVRYRFEQCVRASTDALLAVTG